MDETVKHLIESKRKLDANIEELRATYAAKVRKLEAASTAAWKLIDRVKGAATAQELDEAQAMLEKEWNTHLVPVRPLGQAREVTLT